jgi:arylsulfatase A
MKHVLFFAAIILVLTGSTFVLNAEEVAKPNIIFILVDDQGYYDLGCYAGEEFDADSTTKDRTALNVRTSINRSVGIKIFDTPRIDRMADEGVRFTDYYAAAPICSPSRAGLLTGCYPRRVGLSTWVQRADSSLGIHPDEITLAELLKSQGYATACIGKWHLGFHTPFLPKQQGFDHYFGLLHNLDPVEIVYFEQQGGVPLMRGDEVVKRPADPAELTERYTDEAIAFMREHKSSPFFLYLPHTMLHNPLGVSEPFQGTSRFGEYGDAIQEMDYHVGRLFDELERLEIANETLVVYASDNGRGPGRNEEQPLQGRKLTTWEAGIRVPCIAWGPGVGVKANGSSSAVVHAMDWYPTLATFAGVRVPEGRPIDGRDITPLLKGETEGVPSPADQLSLNAEAPLQRRWSPAGEWRDIITRDEYQNAFFYHGSHGALAAVRWDKWKLYLNPMPTLYDLESDPGETTPARNGEIIRKLRGMTILFQEEMTLDARMPGFIEGDWAQVK